jgi:hypothetical protein
MGKSQGYLASGIALSLIFSLASAQQLPKAGSISVHTGWKSTGEAVEVADKRMQGHGSVIGITFNDKGAGPLHGGPASCFYVFFANDAGTKNKGYCAFGDADGDRIFTDWHGSQGTEGGQGINEIVGGTGKYAGIQGSGPWKCKDAFANGQLNCTQRFDYRLP